MPPSWQRAGALSDMSDKSGFGSILSDSLRRIIHAARTPLSIIGLRPLPAPSGSAPFGHILCVSTEQAAEILANSMPTHTTERPHIPSTSSHILHPAARAIRAIISTDAVQTPRSTRDIFHTGYPVRLAISRCVIPAARRIRRMFLPSSARYGSLFPITLLPSTASVLLMIENSPLHLVYALSSHHIGNA